MTLAATAEQCDMTSLLQVYVSSHTRGLDKRVQVAREAIEKEAQEAIEKRGTASLNSWKVSDVEDDEDNVTEKLSQHMDALEAFTDKVLAADEIGQAYKVMEKGPDWMPDLPPVLDPESSYAAEEAARVMSAAKDYNFQKEYYEKNNESPTGPTKIHMEVEYGKKEDEWKAKAADAEKNGDHKLADKLFKKACLLDHWLPTAVLGEGQEEGATRKQLCMGYYECVIHPEDTDFKELLKKNMIKAEEEKDKWQKAHPPEIKKAWETKPAWAKFLPWNIWNHEVDEWNEEVEKKEKEDKEGDKSPEWINPKTTTPLPPEMKYPAWCRTGMEEGFFPKWN